MILPEDRSNQGPHIVAACIAGIVGLMASSLFDVPWVFPLTTLHVVLLSAIVVSPLSSPRTTLSRAPRLVLAVITLLAAATMVWSDGGHYFQQRAAGAMQDHDWSAAVDNLESATTIDPLLAAYRFQLGMAKAYSALDIEDQTALREAIEAYEREIARGGDTAINNGNLAWLELAVGDTDNAVGHMERAVAQTPNDAYYRLGLGYLLEAAGAYDAAAEAYTAAISRTPTLADSAFWQTSASRKSFKAQVGNLDTLPGLSRAQVAYSAGDYTAAIDILDGLPLSTASLILRGRAETARGEYVAAQEHLNKAVALSQSNPDAHLARGLLYLEVEDETKALQDLRIASLLGHKRADVVLGQIAYQAGDLDKAISLSVGSAPDCVPLAAGYDYASQVYHRSDFSADFWPKEIVCAPYDSLVPYYLQLARAYRMVDRTQAADEVCHWLAGFYEEPHLRQLDEGTDAEWPCESLQEPSISSGDWPPEGARRSALIETGTRWVGADSSFGLCWGSEVSVSFRRLRG